MRELGVWLVGFSFSRRAGGDQRMKDGYYISQGRRENVAVAVVVVVAKRINSGGYSKIL